jgi:hypothetical protein
MMVERVEDKLPDVEDIGGKDAELMRIARDRYQIAVDHEQDNRDAGIEDLEFMAGDQWPEEIRRERNEDGRPILTINRMPAFVKQIVNEIRQNRPAIKVLPGDDTSDDEIADIFTGTIRHIEHQSNAVIAYVTAAEGAAQCGIGHFRITTEYSHEQAFDQVIRIKRIVDPYAVTWDPQAVELDRSDAMYCFYEEAMGLETYKARYPKSALVGFDFMDADSTHLGDWRQGEEIRVAEYWTKTLEKRTLALLDDGRTIDITEMNEGDGVVQDAETGQGHYIKRRRVVERNKVEMRIINGHEVLEGPFEWIGTDIPIIPVIGDETHIGRRTIRNGIIRHAKDPQRMYNYWRAAQTEQIALQPKSPFMVTPKNIAGVEALWNQANTRNMPYLPYAPDDNNSGLPPQRVQPALGSPSMHQEILIAQDDMKATTGVYFDAARAPSLPETSGKAIIARQRQSDISTFNYSDNLKLAIVACGRQLVRIIPKVYDSDRVIRLLNEDGTTEAARINQTVVDDAGQEHRVNDLAVGVYDVAVTTGPSYSTKRTEAADSLLQLVKAVPEAGKVAMDIIVKALDFPGSDDLAERFRKMLPPGMVELKDGEEEPAPPPPSPEEIEAKAKIETDQRDQARKDTEANAKIIEMAAEVAKTEEETEQIKLENLEKAFEFAMANGQFKSMIEGQVEAVLRDILAPDSPVQMPTVAPTGPVAPQPPQAYPTNGAGSVPVQ